MIAASPLKAILFGMDKEKSQAGNFGRPRGPLLTALRAGWRAYKIAGYDARRLKEPWPRVKAIIAASIGLTVTSAVLGKWGDRIHWRPDLCDGDCHWFSRTGALIVVWGTCLAFKSGAVLIKRLPEVDHEGNKTGRGITRPNPDESGAYGTTAIILLIVGTVIWGFGDLRL
jgi:hypothetical protein